MPGGNRTFQTLNFVFWGTALKDKWPQAPVTYFYYNLLRGTIEVELLRSSQVPNMCYRISQVSPSVKSFLFFVHFVAAQWLPWDAKHCKCSWHCEIEGKPLAVSPAPFYRGTRSNVGQYQPTVPYALCLVQLQGCSWNNVPFLIHDSFWRISTELKLYWITFSVTHLGVCSTVSGSGPVYLLPNAGDPLWR